jgi:hypothetical protein
MTENAAADAPTKGTGGSAGATVDDSATTGEGSSPASPPRSADQIQADIDAAQQRLADQVDVLSERLAPQALAEDALGSVKRVFLEEDGTPKRKPIAIVVGTVAGLVLLRKIFHR